MHGMTSAPPTRPVVLCGVKHCGKSTLGALLAEMWHLPFLDTDIVLEEAYAHHFSDGGRRLGVREIFRRLGADEFRRFEAETVRTLATGARQAEGAEDGTKRAVVIATGGGVFSNPYLSDETLRGLGFTVFLDVGVEVAFQRVLRGGMPPFLADAADPRAKFEQICHERRKVFEKYADLIFPIEREVPARQQAAELALRIAEYGLS